MKIYLYKFSRRGIDKLFGGNFGVDPPFFEISKIEISKRYKEGGPIRLRIGGWSRLEEKAKSFF